MVYNKREESSIAFMHRVVVLYNREESTYPRRLLGTKLEYLSPMRFPAASYRTPFGPRYASRSSKGHKSRKRPGRQKQRNAKHVTPAVFSPM